MNAKHVLFAGLISCTLTSPLFGQGNIFPSTQQDFALASTPNNTGLTVVHDAHQVAVYDDGSGSYYFDCIKPGTPIVVFQDVHSGNDPDVAYYKPDNIVSVIFEKAGNIYVQDYLLTSTSPSVVYTIIGTNFVGNGVYPNIDINSNGDGLVTWDDGGIIYAAYYKPGYVGPHTAVGHGSQPDIIQTDDWDMGAITYIESGGDLMIETFVGPHILSGIYTPVTSWAYSPNSIYEFPRIAADRNMYYGGDRQHMTVVAQDYNTQGSAQVDGFFILYGTTMNGPVDVNSDFNSCGGDYPLPAVAYLQGKPRVIWSQIYPSGCTTASNPINYNDVFVSEFNPDGSPSFDYLQVNQTSGQFASFSRNAIASEYDYQNLITPTTYQSGVLYSDNVKLYWKGISSTNPSYLEEQITANHEKEIFSLTTNQLDQTIEVISEDDAPASFTLLDNAGRIVELKNVVNNGQTYTIDISHLSGGMYFLQCSSEASEEVFRVLQVRK